MAAGDRHTNRVLRVRFTGKVKPLKMLMRAEGKFPKDPPAVVAPQILMWQERKS